MSLRYWRNIFPQSVIELLMQPRAEKVRKLVVICYKNGDEVIVSCDSMSVTRNADGTLAEIEWSGIRPRPLFLGIAEIQSVWEIK